MTFYIRDYFKVKLGLDLELYATSAARSNLRYEVLYQAGDNEKYETLRRLIEQKNCPTIIYVSRTKRTVQIAQKLTNAVFVDGTHIKANANLHKAVKKAILKAAKEYEKQLMEEINADREKHGKKPFDDDQNGSEKPAEEKIVTECFIFLKAHCIFRYSMV